MPNQTLTYEFLLPSEILLEPGAWDPLSLTRDGYVMSVVKPTAGSKIVPLQGTVGNEGIDMGYSICHVQVNLGETQNEPEWYVPVRALNECLEWIRSIGRQFWVGALPTMSRVLGRGSIISENGSYKNFGGYTTRLPVGPLTKIQWEWIGRQLQAGHAPSVPEVLLSDALISFSHDDYLQTVIRLGIVCELELNAFVEDLLTRQPKAVQELYDERKPFEWKLKNVPGILGAEKYQDHNNEWTKALCTLYGLRGLAIHHAAIQVNGKDIDFADLSRFLFATFDFLNWTEQQRVRLGLPGR